MQISAANLLASQSQTVARPQSTAPAFAPIAFKQSAATATLDMSQETRNGETASAAPTKSNGTTAAPYGGYVRPGTNLDIKI